MFLPQQADRERPDLAIRALHQPAEPLGAPVELVCEVFLLVGGVCEDCPDGSGPYCVEIDVRELVGVDSAIAVVPRTAEEIAADPTCP